MTPSDMPQEKKMHGKIIILIFSLVLLLNVVISLLLQLIYSVPVTINLSATPVETVIMHIWKQKSCFFNCYIFLALILLEGN